MLMSLVAVVGVSAIASTSAMAALHYNVCEKVTAGTGQWNNSECSELGGAKSFATKAVTTVLEVKGTVGISKLKTTIASTKVVIICKTGKVVGEIEGEGKSKATITYENCELENETTKEILTGCPVPNIKAVVADRLTETSGLYEDEFIEEGKEFAKVVIEKCTLKGTFPVTGSQKCMIPSGQAYRLDALLDCEPAGSSLKFNGSTTATYEGSATLLLVDGNGWAPS